MKLRNLRIDSQPQLMIIPMIDIIFFLLVFFMMSTLYMVEQHTIPVNLPQAAAAQSEPTRSINITVLSDGRVVFEQEELPLQLLQRRISLELQKQPDSVFVLRGDEKVEYGNVIEVLDQMKQAGARRVAVAAELKAR